MVRSGEFLEPNSVMKKQGGCLALCSSGAQPLYICSHSVALLAMFSIDIMLLLWYLPRVSFGRSPLHHKELYIIDRFVALARTLKQ